MSRQEMESEFIDGAMPEGYRRGSGKLRAVLGCAALVMTLGIAYGQHEAEQEERIASLTQQADAQTRVNDRIVRILGREFDAESYALRGDGLASLEELAANGREVGYDAAEVLRNATVKLSAHPKDDSAPWIDHCTGTKVILGGVPYVATAAHCLGKDKLNGVKGALPSNAVDIHNVSPQEYAVSVYPSSDQDGGGLLIDKTVVSWPSDWGLLRVSPEQLAGSAFESLPAVNLDEIASVPPPRPGDRVAAVSYPSAAQGQQVLDQGIYLGRARDDVSGYEADYVALLHADAPEQDACNFGASGSGFVSDSGYFGGPLAQRSNTGYHPPRRNAPDQERPAALMRRLRMEQALGVDLSSVVTVCEYSVTSPAVIADLQDGLDQDAARLGFTYMFGGK